MELQARQRLLLSFLGAGGSSPIDPIRIMKGIFLICQRLAEGALPAGARYDFVPYSYGPCSFEIYSDLEVLARIGLVQANEVLGVAWKTYSLTPPGIEEARQTLKGLDPDARNYITRVRKYVSSVSFGDLLRAVYAAYPAYAANSVFRAS
jgi:hypothetical protein